MQIEFACPTPNCGARIGVRAELAGGKVRCPQCRQIVHAPDEAEPAPDRTESASVEAEAGAPPEPDTSAEIRLEVVRELARAERIALPPWAPVIALTAMVGFAAQLFMNVTASLAAFPLVLQAAGLIASALAVIHGTRLTGISRAVTLVLAGLIMLYCATAAAGAVVGSAGLGGAPAIGLAAIGMGVLAGAAATARAGRWDVSVRVLMGVSGAWLLFHAAVLVLRMLLVPAASDAVCGVAGPGTLLRAGGITLFGLTAAALLAATVHSLLPTHSRVVASLTVGALQIVGWTLVLGVLVGAFEASASASLGARAQMIAERTVAWTLVVLSVYTTAFGLRGLLTESKS